jgi:hypothetical protein
VSSPRQELRQRRARLVERAAVERETVAANLGRFVPALEMFDRAQSVVRVTRRALPAISWGIGVGMAALAFIRPTNITGWISRGAEILRAFRHREVEVPARPAEGAEPRG